MNNEQIRTIHRNQAVIAEQTKELILMTIPIEDIIRNKHLKDAMGW